MLGCSLHPFIYLIIQFDGGEEALGGQSMAMQMRNFPERRFD